MTDVHVDPNLSPTEPTMTVSGIVVRVPAWRKGNTSKHCTIDQTPLSTSTDEYAVGVRNERTIVAGKMPLWAGSVHGFICVKLDASCPNTYRTTAKVSEWVQIKVSI